MGEEYSRFNNRIVQQSSYSEICSNREEAMKPKLRLDQSRHFQNLRLRGKHHSRFSNRFSGFSIGVKNKYQIVLLDANVYFFVRKVYGAGIGGI